MRERQLTHDTIQKNLDSNLNFSPDGEWLVFDCRDEKGLPACNRVGIVNIYSGELNIIYETKLPISGVGAASFLNSEEVITLHALQSGLPYDFAVRGGLIIPTDGKSAPRWLDSRDVYAPFTPGALRGGTHKHEPDDTGEWVGFTYNDWIMKFHCGSDLRNVGVSRRVHRVNVPLDERGRNVIGESFSVLLTTCVDHPRPGSDEYARAEYDCWVGKNGYVRADGKLQRARAFKGTVAVVEHGRTVVYGDVFLIDIPEDLTVPGLLGPLEGTTNDYPKPPRGTKVSRLTHTAANENPELRGIRGHLRSSGNGQWIVFVGKATRSGRIEEQLFVVSPQTAEVRQLSRLPGGVNGIVWPRFSPDSSYVVAGGIDNALYMISAKESNWGESHRITPPHQQIPENLVISPNSRIIAYNRVIDKVMQVFLTEV